jgi:hypothetical protein
MSVLFALPENVKVLFALLKHIKSSICPPIYITLSRAMTNDWDQWLWTSSSMSHNLLSIIYCNHHEACPIFGCNLPPSRLGNGQCLDLASSGQSVPICCSSAYLALLFLTAIPHDKHAGCHLPFFLSKALLTMELRWQHDCRHASCTWNQSGWVSFHDDKCNSERLRRYKQHLCLSTI